MTTLADALIYAIFGLNLGILLGLMVAPKLHQNWEYLSRLSKEEAQECIEEIADDVILALISDRLREIFELEGVAVAPEVPRLITDTIFNSPEQTFEDVFAFFNDLMMSGVASESYLAALSVLDHLNQPPLL